MISFDHLTYAYHKGGTRAVDDVTLCLEPGQPTVVLGQRGAGKTTLLRLAAGLLRPDKGTVLVEGGPPKAAYGRLAYLAGQGSGLPFHTPASQGRFLEEFWPGFQAQRYQQLLEQLRVPEKPLTKLSPVQRARAELAAGFAKGADLLLMDDPLAGEAPYLWGGFPQLLEQNLRGSETLLIATNQPELATAVGGRVLVLHKGQLADDFLLAELEAEGVTLEQRLAEAIAAD